MIIHKKHVTLIWALLTILTLFFLLIWFAGPLSAGPSLPPRDNPTPTPASGGDINRDGGDVSGAYIILRVLPITPTLRPVTTTLWTVVQWEDAQGGWHDVEGWRGTLEANAEKWWWVASRDYGSGPFRWVVYHRADGVMLAASESFYLPSGANEWRVVEVWVE